MLWTKECGAMSTSRSHKSLTRRNIFGKPTQSHRYIQHNVARLLLLSSSGCPDRFQLKEFRAPGALANCKLRSDFYHKKHTKTSLLVGILPKTFANIFRLQNTRTTERKWKNNEAHLANAVSSREPKLSNLWLLFAPLFLSIFGEARFRA